MASKLSFRMLTFMLVCSLFLGINHVTTVAYASSINPMANQKQENVVLTLTDEPATSMNISWKTGTLQQQSVVQIVSADDEQQFKSKNIFVYTGNANLVAVSTGKFMQHRVTVKNLAPGITYRYRVGDGQANWSKSSTFTTAEVNPKSFGFLFGTDTQSYNAKGYDYWRRLTALGMKKFSNTNFIVHGGDIVDDGKDFHEWQYFLDASNVAFSTLPFMSIMGNHDVYGAGENVFKSLFYYQLNSPKGKEGYTYSFDYGNARFIMLNTEFGAVDMRAQVAWLEQRVKTAGDRWTIVMMHRAPYASNPLGGGSGNAKSILTPVIERLGVDLVLSGHDHSYMRTKPIKNGVPAKDGKGTLYITGGSAGPKFYPAEVHAYTKKLYDTNVQVISHFSITGNQFTGEVINLNGQLIDKFTLTKK